MTSVRTIRAIVAAYVAEYRDCAAAELRYYARQRNLARTVELAALSKLPSGKRHPHQCRISGIILAKAARLLAQTNFSSVSSFHDLHARVNDAISKIKGIGPLAVYDIAHRIGSHLGHAPDRVYLHRGALVGARALGLGGEAVQISDLPRPFQRLTPAEAEDCLCIYKEELKRLSTR